MAATMATATKCMSLNPSPPKLQNQTKPKPFISLPTSPKPNVSLAVTSTALAGAVFSSLSYSEPALAIQQIAQLAAADAGSDNRGLALLLPIIPAIAWVLYNILQPAINQVNKMRESKGIVVGLGIGGGLAASGLLTPPPEAYAAAESETVLVVRRRPHMVNGGGFIVSNSKQQVVFRVHGCGVLGSKGKLLLRNGDGNDLLLIRKMGGIVQALNMVHKKWEGFGYDNEGAERLVFTLKDPKDSCLVQNSPIKILVHGKPLKISSTRNNYVEITGSFAERACNIINSEGRTIAKVRIEKEIEEMVGNKKDLYHVIVKPNVDQAFIVGLIAILDYIHGESTIC